VVFARSPRGNLRWVVLAILGTMAFAKVEAQELVRLEVSLSTDSLAGGSRDPLVRVRNLLEDDRWLSVLRSGFPIRLHFRLELWRNRGVWFDALQRQVEWDVVVRREPLLDQYTVNTITPTTVGERRYATLDALANALEYAYRITIHPTSSAEYYYATVLSLSTLSESDLDELDRFLRGDLGSAASGEENLGDALSRGAKRLLLNLAGMPSLRLEARSDRFRVP
jgi:hypothetical protein